MGNREKVWKAEEREKEDQKKLDELRRELQEERELDEMRRQRDSARGVERAARVDFLYQEPLGYKDNDINERFREDPMNNEVKQLISQPGSLFVGGDEVDPIADMRAKVRDDPLFFIKKQQQNLQRDIVDNPIKMKQLREQILREKLQEELKEKKRKSGNTGESDRHKKKSKRDRDEKASEWLEKPRADERQSSRDSDRLKYEKEVSRDMQSMRDEYKERKELRGGDAREAKREDLDRERDRDDDRGQSRAQPRDSHRRDHDRERRGDDRERRAERRRDGYDEDVRRDTARRDRDSSRGGAGSSSEVKKERDSAASGSSSASRKKKTHEEQMKALEAMEATANAAREERQARILEKQAEREEEKRQLTQRAETQRDTDRLTGPAFLSSMSKDVYEGGSTASLQDRVSRGKHYIQRGEGNDNSYKR